jgi:hypothetical protein
MAYLSARRWTRGLDSHETPKRPLLAPGLFISDADGYSRRIADSISIARAAASQLV